MFSLDICIYLRGGGADGGYNGPLMGGCVTNDLLTSGTTPKITKYSFRLYLILTSLLHY
jgi:hypothetical protein